ncbi:MAG TPA: N-acetylmuramoyl-L-alanine amidase [Planctomycetota bacterium]|nr:N-acetylmuramoyl-L-alanine amidase [Planctomycetota bacterium]
MLFSSALLVLAVVVLAAVAAKWLKGGPGPAPAGQAIAIGGVLYPIGTPVVLWNEPGGYDAYQKRCRDNPARVLPTAPAPGADTPERIGARSPAGADLRALISQLVIHYDAAYTSRNCFHVLQDERGLSVHFMCDLDGTLYQTCDVAERARHAREANNRSVGVEVAHPGALEGEKGLAARYRRDALGTFLELPPRLAAEPLRTPGFVARPARPEPVRGTIQGRVQTQYDFTDAQYRALAHLAAGLSRALPRIPLEVPRDAQGRVLDRAFPDPAAAAAFAGVVGHWHLQTDKFDPGPAFDWDRFLAEARALK